MVCTVTLNPALDRTVGADGERIDPGGKGLNVAKTLGVFGVPATAAGFAAGETGAELVRLAQAQGLCLDMTPTAGQTRVNTKVFDGHAVTEHNQPGPVFDPAAFDALQAKLRLCSDDTLALCGSLPPGAPADCYARLAAQCPGRVVVDTSGTALKAALAERPGAIKPNLAELEQLMERKLPDPPSRADAAETLCQLGIRVVLLSLGEDGAMLATADGIWYAAAPDVPVRGTVGAGDAMTAQLCRLPWDDAPALLRACVAAGSAAVMQPGSQPLQRSDYDALLQHVNVQRYR